MGWWHLRRAASAPSIGAAAACGALAAALASGCTGSPAPPPDRILLVTIDTLRADRLGSYGARGVRTPHLDALAARGVRFTTAISPAPLTLPAHASLLTALEPPHHGVRHNGVHRLAAAFPTLAESLRAAGYATAAFVGARVLERRFGLARGFDHYDDRATGPSGEAVGYAERRAGEVVDAALEWLASAPARCFVWVHVYDPHAAYAPPPGFAAAFAARPYDGEVAYVDHSLGRLFEALAPGARGGTLIAVTSDHGESLGEHGEATHSYSLYDATQRVPLILAGAGLPRGHVVDALVRLVDVAPTLIAIAGATRLRDADGESLLPLLAGGTHAPRFAYLETLATHLDHGWSPLVGLRSERWKYVRAPRPELYDLAEDPGETRDLASRETERTRELEDLLRQRLAHERAGEPLEVRAEDLELLRALGYAVPQRGDLDATSRAAGADPKDGRDALARLARAEELAGRGDPAAGLALLSEVDAAPAVLALRAALALRAGDPAAAARDARALLARDPSREDARRLLAAARKAAERPRSEAKPSEGPLDKAAERPRSEAKPSEGPQGAAAQ